MPASEPPGDPRVSAYGKSRARCKGLRPTPPLQTLGENCANAHLPAGSPVKRALCGRDARRHDPSDNAAMVRKLAEFLPRRLTVSQRAACTFQPSETLFSAPAAPKRCPITMVRSPDGGVPGSTGARKCATGRPKSSGEPYRGPFGGAGKRDRRFVAAFGNSSARSGEPSGMRCVRSPCMGWR